MRTEFTPLGIDMEDAELVYVSNAKLEQLLMSPEKAGFGASVGGFGLSTDSRARGTRELLDEAGKLFERQGLLRYENRPERGSWLLVRARLMCGTAWPWAGLNDPASRLTAWWVGSSQSLRILAYGHRDHLLGQGKRSGVSNEEHKATWWPSEAGTYAQLLKDIAVHVDADSLELTPTLKSDESFAEDLRGLESYFFSNPGVERGDPLEPRGVFEMMLRVDHVVAGDGRTTVMGSPLWVARERRPVPGVYQVVPFDDESRQDVLGDWDGVRWCALVKRTHPTNLKASLGEEPTMEPLPLESAPYLPAEPSIYDIVNFDRLPDQEPLVPHQVGQECLRCRLRNSLLLIARRSVRACSHKEQNI